MDKHFRTSVEGVYAAGDVLGPTLASIAMEQGRVAVCHAFGIPFEGAVDPSPVSAIYSMPEVSGAGLPRSSVARKAWTTKLVAQTLRLHRAARSPVGVDD